MKKTYMHEYFASLHLERCRAQLLNLNADHVINLSHWSNFWGVFHEQNARIDCTYKVRLLIPAEGDRDGRVLKEKYFRYVRSISEEEFKEII